MRMLYLNKNSKNLTSSNLEKLMAAFVSISGLITMIFGVFILIRAPQYINPLLKNNVILGVRDGI
ncbi:MAG: hypothetical protein ACP5UV_06730, partial [Thermoplasmata archaeon]